jgi:ATP phosphoribosyltransferase regulatory subunit
MVAESAQQFEALEAQAAALMENFGAAGYERIAPAMIQPADVYLDRVGEAIRGRTYLFSDLSGEELCLRPDLTVPVCRLYLERHPQGGHAARYCYNGPAFRYQPNVNSGAEPREFRQAGIESIGESNREKADAEVFALALEGLREAGLEGFRITIGDLGLFEALILAIDMPERWRQRLWRNFWRPAAFHDLLYRLAAGKGGWISEPAGVLLAEIDADDIGSAEEWVEKYLDAQSIPLIGNRTCTEIAERLVHRAADAREAPLADEAVKLIEDYMRISGPPEIAVGQVASVAKQLGLDLSGAIERFENRLQEFAAHGVNVGDMEFGAVFGRNIEYYTGFVFQIELPKAGKAGQVAGGGRYDGLLTELGAPKRIPAVGCAIHTERVLAAVNGAA